MKKILLLAALFTATAAYSQKTVMDANAQKRPAKNFHAIEASDGIDLYITQGGDEALAVSASSSEYRDKIHSEVVNGVLKLYYDRPRSGWNISWGLNRKLKAYISVKTLDALSASGGSDVNFENDLKIGTLAMHLSGGSDLRGSFHGESLSVSASGGSDVFLSGQVNSIRINASGGSDVHGYEMTSNYCTVDTSGGSDVKITVNKEISGSASGGSDLYYRGNAVSTAGKSGGSSVKKTG
ncbi:head GIN domain-containing protein [Sediminibacterium soli]|uniref:head GIN domain-containing protein n=1 Tax=Sediminibacterium soli TaxID=2698829 RepID=UPI00137A7A6A|nr:head GIN domain-containing protein [Sediminibacterium soli]NCI46294.1 DUF2807 domain-containing protein [Sediminibacterium soli]